MTAFLDVRAFLGPLLKEFGTTRLVVQAGRVLRFEEVTGRELEAVAKKALGDRSRLFLKALRDGRLDGYEVLGGPPFLFRGTLAGTALPGRRDVPSEKFVFTQGPMSTDEFVKNVGSAEFNRAVRAVLELGNIVEGTQLWITTPPLSGRRIHSLREGTVPEYLWMSLTIPPERVSQASLKIPLVFERGTWKIQAQGTQGSFKDVLATTLSRAWKLNIIGGFAGLRAPRAKQR